jgi:N-acetylmuramoyl-L-alanine amidase
MSNKRKDTSYVIIHSSNTTPVQILDVKDLDTEHRKKGLLSCAYHYVIKRDGTVQEGRDILLSGVHIEGNPDITNKNSIGVCLIGGKSLKNGTPDCNYTFKQYTSLVSLIKELKDKYTVSVLGHRDVEKSTLCPNFDVAELLS